MRTELKEQNKKETQEAAKRKCRTKWVMTKCILNGKMNWVDQTEELKLTWCEREDDKREWECVTNWVDVFVSLVMITCSNSRLMRKDRCSRLCTKRTCNRLSPNYITPPPKKARDERTSCFKAENKQQGLLVEVMITVGVMFWFVCPANNSWIGGS